MDDDSTPPPGFTGLWRFRRSDVTYEEEYRAGVRHGLHRRIHSSGTVIWEGRLEVGLEHGTFTVRRVDGKVLDETEFVRGTGTFRIFTSAGALAWEIPYVAGKPHGIKRHFRGGHVVSEQEFRDGVPTGPPQRRPNDRGSE